MATQYSPKIVTNGLVLALDTANVKSYNNTFRQSTINTTNWTASSGGVVGYNQNGATNKNQRVVDTDPFGNSSIVWETRPDGTGEADGGWNSDWFNIDNTKLYRFSVWMRRTSSTSGGTFYLGLYGSGPTWGVIRTDNGANEGNPYWECAGTSKYTQNQWYLVVGHCYPNTQSSSIRHPNTGIYTIANGTTKVFDVNGCNIGNDVRWLSDTTIALHRTYHYYCADSTTRLQFFDPRVDLVDGTEPSIADLLSGNPSREKNLVNIGTSDGFLINSPIYDNSNGGSILFDGVNDYIDLGTSLSSNFSSGAVSIFSVARISSVVSKNTLVSFNGAYNFFLPGNRLTTTYQLYWDSGVSWKNGNTTNWATNQWYHFGWTISGTTLTFYVNGIADGTATVSAFSPSSNTRIGFANAGEYATGNIANIFVYNRALTQTEVVQNFNATRARFGI